MSSSCKSSRAVVSGKVAKMTTRASAKAAAARKARLAALAEKIFPTSHREQYCQKEYPLRLFKDVHDSGILAHDGVAFSSVGRADLRKGALKLFRTATKGIPIKRFNNVEPRAMPVRKGWAGAEPGTGEELSAINVWLHRLNFPFSQVKYTLCDYDGVEDMVEEFLTHLTSVGILSIADIHALAEDYVPIEDDDITADVPSEPVARALDLFIASTRVTNDRIVPTDAFRFKEFVDAVKSLDVSSQPILDQPACVAGWRIAERAWNFSDE